MIRAARAGALLSLLGQILLILAGGWFLLHFYANKADLTPEPTSSQRLAEQVKFLNDAHPDYLFIGDSMLSTRIDPVELARLAKRPVYLYCRGGASSAAWYLYFKNVVLRSRVKPRAIIFFFRNQYLTWPRFRVDGMYHTMLDRVTFGEDKLVTKLLRPDPPPYWDGAGWARRWLVEPGGFFYSKTASNQFHNRLENLALDFSSFGAKKDDRRAAMAQRFNLKSLRADLQAELPPAGSAADDTEEARPRFFNPSPNASFLPHIVDLGKKSGIPLIFFRVKTRPGPDNVTFQPPELIEYTKNLRAWLENQGCRMFDETNDPKITLSMYQDGDHINDPSQKGWTDYFYERVGASLP